MAALGGDDALSPQRRRLVDLAARAALLVDHVDAWLFTQRSLVNARNRTLLPIVVQRVQLADHLARLLDKLGLERVPRKVPTLAEYLTSRNGELRAPGTPAPPPGAPSEAPPPETVVEDAAPDEHGATDPEAR